MKENCYPHLKALLTPNKWIIFMLTSVSHPTLLILLVDNGLLMGAEMLMMTLGKPAWVQPDPLAYI